MAGEKPDAGNFGRNLPGGMKRAWGCLWQGKASMEQI